MANFKTIFTFNFTTKRSNFHLNLKYLILGTHQNDFIHNLKSPPMLIHLLDDDHICF